MSGMPAGLMGGELMIVWKDPSKLDTFYKVDAVIPMNWGLMIKNDDQDIVGITFTEISTFRFTSRAVLSKRPARPSTN